MTEPADLPTLLDISAEISWPDSEAEAATRARLAAGGLGPRTFGRLGDLAIWLSGVQGVSPPREPRRPRLVVFSGAADGAQADADAVSHLFADVGGLGVRVVTVASGRTTEPSAGTTFVPTTVPASDPAPAPATDLASVDAANTHAASADRLSAGEVDAAIRAGARAADEEIDAGADLLVAATSGARDPSADVVISVMTLTEPVKVVGLNTAMGDAEWMAWVARVRDDRLRAAPHRHEGVELLAAVGTTQLAAVTGFLLRAAARRTPVLLDGDVVAAATLLARDVTPNVVRWWQPGARSTDPAQALAMEEFGAVAVLDLELGLGAGVGAALAVPLLRAAARAVAELTVAPGPPGAGVGLDPGPAEPEPDLPPDDDVT